MIYRKNFRACLKIAADNEKIEEALIKDREIVKNAIEQQQCLTIALYYYENMLFLYTEGIDKEVVPEHLFPNLSAYSELWPERSGKIPWVGMFTIYYHDIPTEKSYWQREGKKKRRGRIAYLKEDKLFSYTYYHKAIVDEGLLEGDRYQFIALHEDILFSYFEEPKLFTHIKKEKKEQSKVIDDWLAVDPESHFDHTLSGKENFLLLPELFSLGAEDCL